MSFIFRISCCTLTFRFAVRKLRLIHSTRAQHRIMFKANLNSTDRNVTEFTRDFSAFHGSVIISILYKIKEDKYTLFSLFSRDSLRSNTYKTEADLPLPDRDQNISVLLHLPISGRELPVRHRKLKKELNFTPLKICCHGHEFCIFL